MPTDEERIDSEIILAGGLKQIAVGQSYDEMDMVLWKDQALYLSHFRDSGNEEQAALRAGFTLGIVTNWYDDNVLGFQARQKSACRALAVKVRSSLVQQLLDGNIKSASAYKLALEDLDPDRYGAGAGQNQEAIKFMEELRAMHAENKKHKAQELMIDDLEREATGIPPDDMTPADLLRQRQGDESRNA